MSRIVAAMSGGVDSSVAAALLAREAATTTRSSASGCARMRPARGLRAQPLVLLAGCRRRRAPRRADPRHPVLRPQRRARVRRRVIDAFVDAYLDGATPNPCQACNQYIKFDELLRRGLAAYGADGRHRPLRPRRAPRWTLAPSARGRCRQGPDVLPLGPRPGAAQPDALPARRAHEAGGSHHGGRPDPADGAEAGVAGDLLRPARRLPHAARGAPGYAGDPGPIVDAEGTEIGTHTGYAHYTVGQRHGLGVAPARPSTFARSGPRPIRSSSAAATRWPSARSASMALASRPASRRGSASTRRSGSAIGRRMCRRRSRWSATTGSWSRPPSRSGRLPPARPPCCTTATSASAEGASPAPRPDRA